MNQEDYNNNSMYRKLEYAKAYIPPQPYKNLFSLDDVLKTGTIFMDLYEPYDHHKKKKY